MPRQTIEFIEIFPHDHTIPHCSSVDIKLFALDSCQPVCVCGIMESL